MTGVTLIYNFLNPCPYLQTPYPYGDGCSVTVGLHRFTMGFPSYCTVFYIFIINVYIIIYITKLKYPPLTFGAREGREVAVVAHKRIQNPPLAYETREGVVVAVIAHKRTQDPLTHVCSEIVTQKRIPEPLTHI
jgi:hypothetical protein